MPRSARPIILVICNYYLPGYENGGSTRTLANMVDRLGGRYDFRIITSDHDGQRNRTPFKTVEIDEWNTVGNAQVYYYSQRVNRLRLLRRLISEITPDVIYLNSFFSRLTLHTLALRRACLISSVPIILSPDGELAAGALSIKPLKKQSHVKIAGRLKLYQNLLWRAATEVEVTEIKQFAGATANVQVAPCMVPREILPGYDALSRPAKRPGACKFIFLSRIMRTKNLEWLVERFHGVEGAVELDISGPVEDVEYWKECQRVIAELPKTVNVTITGTVRHDLVPETISQNHFFVLPSLGENFGHIFIEALAAGCPMIISDRTPWRDLPNENIGWDLPLESPEAWTTTLNRCVQMTEGEFDEMSRSARSFALGWLSNTEHDRANQRIFESALKGY